MDYDESDFQNHQNLHLAGEASNKLPPVSLPRFDFDDTHHLRFDSLAETESFLGNEDSSWIEDFSRGTSSSGAGVVFSSAATESCVISRHINVWSEASSSESVELLLNSVGQEDQVIVKEKSRSLDELGCTMDTMKKSGQTSHEDILSKEETVNAQPNPSVDDTPGDSSVIKTGAEQEQVPVKDASPTVAEVSSMEEDNAILASNTAAVDDVDSACHDKIGTVTTDSHLDQTVAEELSIEEKNADVASNPTIVEDVSSTEHDKIGTEITDSLLTIVEESSMEDNNTVLASVTMTREAVETAGHDKIGTETTGSLDQTVAEELSIEEKNADVASDSAIVENVSSTEHDKIGTETTDSPLTLAEESSKEENNTVLASVTMTREAVNTSDPFASRDFQ